jgi:hypothetical protein
MPRQACLDASGVLHPGMVRGVVGDPAKYGKLCWPRVHHAPPTPPGVAAAPERLTYQSWPGPPVRAPQKAKPSHRRAPHPLVDAPDQPGAPPCLSELLALYGRPYRSRFPGHAASMVTPPPEPSRMRGRVVFGETAEERPSGQRRRARVWLRRIEAEGALRGRCIRADSRATC